MAKIREIREEDLNEVYEIERLSFREPYPKTLLLIYSKICRETFLVVENGSGKIKGYIIGLIKWNILGHIISLAIHPEHRRKGYAKMLIRELLQRFKINGVKVVRLEVRVSNRPAINLYSKMGFKIAYTLKNFYLNGEDAYVMYKVLD